MIWTSNNHFGGRNGANSHNSRYNDGFDNDLRIADDVLAKVELPMVGCFGCTGGLTAMKWLCFLTCDRPWT